MSNSLQSEAAQSNARRSPWSVMAAVMFMLFAMSLLLAMPRVEAAVQMSDEALDTLVGPIALYPDDLVAIILPAATNPLQLVQADRFLQKRKDNPDLALDEGWDDSVKSLLNYPDIVAMMSADLDWTSALGEAVVEDQGAVLEGIQSFRRRAQAAGHLNSDNKQVVVVEKEVIKIVPADPEVIYVPQYEPSTVIVTGVAPVYGYYPTAYPSYYYPYAPGAALATGIIWGAAMGAIWSGGRYGCNYGGYGGNNNINIDRNVNINTGDINRGNVNSGNRGGQTAWKSNKQPGQVSSSIGKNRSSNRVGDSGGSRGSAGGARASTQPAGGDRGGDRGGADRGESRGGDFSGAERSGGRDNDFGGGSRGGGDAFGGYDSGRQTRADSSRGASSRSSMSSGSRGGGSRGGAGGGRGGGGGRR